MGKALASVDRLAWDRAGLDMRFRHYAPTLCPSDRGALVEACLNAPSFGMTAADFFEQIRAQLAPKGKRK